MTTYRVGILGAGFMGRTHAWCWRSLPFYYEKLGYRIELAGVATSRRETAEAARDELGFARAFDSAEELISDAGIDLVDIATPNHLHAAALLAAERAGKPVYCDKPLTGRLDQAQRLATELRDPATAGQMVLQYRFYTATMRARQIVEAGELGEVIGFRVAYLHSGNVAPGKRLAWKDRRDLGGGVLYDLGSHALDLLTWLCGEALVEVVARQKTLHPRRPSLEDPAVLAEQDSDDLTVMLLRLAGGAVGSLEASKIATGAQDDLRFELHGSRGALRFALMEPNYLDWFDAADPELPLGGSSGFKRLHCVQRYPPPAVLPAPKVGIGWIRGHLHCLYSFITAVHEGRPFDPSIARGLELETWLDAAARAASSGQALAL